MINLLFLLASQYLSLNEIASVFVNQDDLVFRYHSNITDQTVWTSNYIIVSLSIVN